MLNLSRIASRAAGACALALALLSPVHAAPVLQMSAATSATGIDLTVRAQDVTDLYGYQFTLNFDPALLKAIGGTEGSFLSSGGSTFFDPGSIDNIAGSISFVFDSLIGAINGVDGSGDLATFSFDVLQGGFANFSFSDVFFLDSNFAEISIEARSLVAQVPEPATLWLTAIALFAVLGARTRRARTL